MPRLLTRPAAQRVTATGDVGPGNSGYAIYSGGPTPAPFTITNFGTITGGLGANNKTIRLVDGGIVNNAGVIARGIYISGTAGVAVTNSGTGSITGSLNGDVAVSLVSGGIVSNAGGLIDGYVDGVRITGAAGTVTNSGTATIAGAGTAGAIGVYLAAGGTVANTGGRITRSLKGVKIVGAAGVVTNYNYAEIDGGGVYLAAGGGVTNKSHSFISGSFSGVYLGTGGSVTNDTSASITGTVGVSAVGAAGTVTNSGGGGDLGQLHRLQLHRRTPQRGRHSHQYERDDHRKLYRRLF